MHENYSRGVWRIDYCTSSGGSLYWVIDTGTLTQMYAETQASPRARIKKIPTSCQYLQHRRDASPGDSRRWPAQLLMHTVPGVILRD